MRIGIDCRLWNETGVGRYTRNLVKELKTIDKVNEYVLFALSKDLGKISESVDDKWKIVESTIRWHTISEQIEFPKILLKENLDLVHFPYFSVPIFYNKPFVVTIHDLIIHHFSTGQASTLPYPLYALKLQAYKFVISEAARKAKRILAVSEATKKEIVSDLHVAPEKIEVTYEGVEVTQGTPPKNMESFGFAEYFIYVGNSYPHKNLNRLLNAFRIVRESKKNVGLVLVGKNDYFSSRLKEQQKDLRNILFLGEKNDEDLSVLYQGATALVMPSLMEGFGLPPLEAMAMNCPVVVSDIPSLREICNNAAIYFDPSDTKDIAEKMASFLSFTKSEREAFQKRGKKRAGDFSWKKMAEQTLRVYNAVGNSS